MLFGIALEIGAVVLELTGPIPAIGLIAFFVALAGGFCALAGALFLAFPSAPNPRA